MRTNRAVAGLVFLLVQAWSLPRVTAQETAPAEQPASAKIWVGRAQEFEEYLRNAEIVKMEALSVGVTRPSRAWFAPGGLFESMAWKGIKPGRYSGHWESYKSEIASYELDKILEMNMIPPTVEKRVKGELGAAVMWVSPVKSFTDMGGPPAPPPVHMSAWNKQLVRAKMLDNLINNRDPNLGNWLVDPSWNLILIDHTRAFEAGKNPVHDLTRVDRELWERFKTLTEEGLQAALGQWLDERAIRGVLERRERMQADIDKLVAAKGEAAVFLP